MKRILTTMCALTLILAAAGSHDARRKSGKSHNGNLLHMRG